MSGYSQDVIDHLQSVVDRKCGVWLKEIEGEEPIIVASSPEELDSAEYCTEAGLTIFRSRYVSEAAYIDGPFYCLTQAGVDALDKHTNDALPDNIDDHDWPKQIDVAKRLGKQPMEVQRLCDDRVLKTNGKEGKAKRIDPASVLAFCDREGITYNDT